jgi:hypothetical protein
MEASSQVHPATRIGPSLADTQCSTQSTTMDGKNNMSGAAHVNNSFTKGIHLTVETMINDDHWLETMIKR